MKLFEEKYFEEFIDIYLYSFSRLISKIDYLKSGQKIIIGVPSTEYIDTNNTNFFEYALAKRNTEIFCDSYFSKNCKIEFIVKRLPK